MNLTVQLLSHLTKCHSRLFPLLALLRNRLAHVSSLDQTVHEVYSIVNEQIINNKCKKESTLLDEIEDIQQTNVDIILYGVNEVCEGLQNGLVKKVIGVKKHKKIKKIKNLLHLSGAKYISLETPDAMNILENNYGGFVAYKWF